MFRDRVGVMQHLVNSKISRDQHPGGGAAHAQQAEKLQRARGIIQQEFHDHQVQEHADGTADSVIGLSILAVGVFDRHFGDFRAAGTGKSGNEAVQFAVELNFLDNLAAVGLESRPEVVQVDSRKLGHHPIGDAAGKLAGQPGVVALVAPAADEVVAFLELFDEARNLSRIVL